MHPLIVRNLLSPLHEWILGRRTFRYWRDLNREQWYAPEELRALQAEKLRRLLCLASDHCAFYRERFADSGVDPSVDDPFSVLGRLPLLDKGTIRANRERMTYRDCPAGVYASATGGSTGEPLVFHYDRRRIAYDKAARMCTHQWFGVLAGEREAYLWGAPAEIGRQEKLRTWRDRLTNELLLSAFNMSSEMMRRYLDSLARYNPAALFGYPSSIALLCEFGRSIGRVVRPSNLRCVFVSGEALDAGQRATISDYFQVPVADGYGSREAGFLAHECPDGRLHVMSQNLIIEVVDAEGGPVPVGKPGEIVITHLDAWAMPMIRYRTEDLGRLASGSCRCGRGLPLMDMVAGRRTDHLVAADGTLKHALSLIYVLRDIDSVGRFHIRQGPRRDVDIRVVPQRGFGDGERRRIESGVRRQLGGGIDLRVRLVDRIETCASGKHCYVTSEAVRTARAGSGEGDVISGEGRGKTGPLEVKG
ncbi:MAG: phenylacetate--CoA ligase family protein [bacterium]|nr:phenylacetate--CoA ligase family protein [bacterium]